MILSLYSLATTGRMATSQSCEKPESRLKQRFSFKSSHSCQNSLGRFGLLRYERLIGGFRARLSWFTIGESLMVSLSSDSNYWGTCNSIGARASLASRMTRRSLAGCTLTKPRSWINCNGRSDVPCRRTRLTSSFCSM